MIFAHQIRTVVAEYVQRKVDADQFVRNFAPLSHDILLNGQHEAIRLANVAEALLADFRSGCIPELQFRSALSEAFSLDQANTLVQSFSVAPVANHYVAEESAFPVAPAAFGTAHGTESGLIAFHPA